MKDRGAIKWSAMMLPEHKKFLEKMYAEKEHREKPILDQDKYEEINRVLLFVWEKEKAVKIKFYREDTFQCIEGIITKYIPGEKKLKIIDNSGKVEFLYLDQIVDAEIS